MSIEGSRYDVLATCGNDHLGGEDFNQCLVEHLAKTFKEKTQKDPMTSESSDKNIRRLYKVAEDLKHRLTSQHEVDIEFTMMGVEDFRMTVLRSKFEDLCKDLFKECLKNVEDCLKEAKISKEAVDEVLLVGGSSRIPKVQHMLKEFFNGKQLNKTINPDEVVAYGAALQAASFTDSGHQEVQELVLHDVTPLSFGVGINQGFRKMSKVINRQTKIPVQKAQPYATLRDYQTSARFPIYQGEHDDTNHNKYLGELELLGIRPAPAGEIKFTVNFSLDENGILRIDAQDTTNPANKKKLQIDMHQTGHLNAEEIEDAIHNAERINANSKEAQRAKECQDLA